MNRTHRKNALHPERGVALFIAILTLLLITAIAAGLILLTNSDMNISANFRDEQTAFFGAKAGIEEVRDRLRQTSPGTSTLSGGLANLDANLPGNNNGVLYILNPTGGETDTPWNTLTSSTAYPDNEICSEITAMGGTCTGSPAVPGGTPWYLTANADATYAATPTSTWKWTRVTAKANTTSSGSSSNSYVDGNSAHTTNYRACWNSTAQTEVATTSGCRAAGYQPVYVLTTLSVTASGSRRMVQAEAITDMPTFPGAMIFDGPTPAWSDPNSNRFSVDGADHSGTAGHSPSMAGVTCPAAANQYAMGGYNAASATSLSTGLSRPSSYTGVGGSPSVGNVGSQLGPLATVQGLQQLVSQVLSAASSANIYSGNATALTNPGTPSAPVINVVKGDLTISGGLTGSGIVLVEGTLTMSGNPDFNGLVLVIGKGAFVKSGGGNGTLDGSLFVANLFDGSGNPITSGAPGIPSINWGGGGNATIQYDSCWASAMNMSLPYRIVAMREMMF